MLDKINPYYIKIEKSFPLFALLKMLPYSTYVLITGGSDKFMFNVKKDAMKHKTLIVTEALLLQKERIAHLQKAF